MTPSPFTILDEKQFSKHATSFLQSLIGKAIHNRNMAVVGLSGGSTPKPIYEELGKEKGIDWSKVWLFLVDDRFVRKDDPRSNQFLLRSTLLKEAPIPESQIILPDTSLPLEQCIELYDRELSELLKKGPADVVTLGLGEDGHIASLFPPLTKVAFGPDTVIHTTTDRFDVHDRISVTLPVIQNAQQKVFFLKGEGKQKTWEEMMESEEDEKRWPAKGAMKNGDTTVLLAV